MISFEKFELDNGLRFIIHRDSSSPMLAFNVLYDVGAKDESPGKTGFAHLFEHLMFGGSVHIPDYDIPLETAGGDNNAFTNNDITNYYLTLPKQNMETAFWLESDRMLNLAFSEKSLEVQRGVVIEEFKQTYLNQPYGDAWLLLRPLIYKTHPYRWPTIGKEISHIENATMKDVKAFYSKFYNPNNAIISIAGNVTKEEILPLAVKWFGDIQNMGTYQRNIPPEPAQNELRTLSVHRDVPQDVIYMAFRMCRKGDPDYFPTDLISDLLSNGDSSRFAQNLVKDKKLFSSIEAFVSGDLEEGLFIIIGKLQTNTSMQEAENAIRYELEEIQNGNFDEDELEKVKNKVEANLIFSEVDILNKAMNLAFYELMGDANLINREVEMYHQVKKSKIISLARQLFKKENTSILYYYGRNTK
jgi:predicted Zn-dependent peptidase